MNPFEKFLQTKGLSVDAFKALETEKQADIQNEYLGSIEKQLENSVSKETLTAELKKADETAKEFLAGEIAKQLLEQGSKGVEKTETLEEQIKSNKDEIKSIMNGDTRKEVVLKANTLRASIVGNTEAIRLNNIGQLGVKRRALYDFFTKIPVGDGNHNGTICLRS